MRCVFPGIVLGSPGLEYFLTDNLGLCSWTGALLKEAKFPTGLVVIFGLQVKIGHCEFYFGFGKAQ